MLFIQLKQDIWTSLYFRKYTGLELFIYFNSKTHHIGFGTTPIFQHTEIIICFAFKYNFLCEHKSKYIFERNQFWKETLQYLTSQIIHLTFFLKFDFRETDSFMSFVTSLTVSLYIYLDPAWEGGAGARWLRGLILQHGYIRVVVCTRTYISVGIRQLFAAMRQCHNATTRQCYNVLRLLWHCGLLVALQTTEAVVPGSNPASVTVEKLWGQARSPLCIL